MSVPVERVHRCDSRGTHADCSNHRLLHEEWCFDGSQCGDKDCDCHRRWAEAAPEPPW